jgi:hypothetical protein
MRVRQHRPGLCGEDPARDNDSLFSMWDQESHEFERVESGAQRFQPWGTTRRRVDSGRLVSQPSIGSRFSTAEWLQGYLRPLGPESCAFFENRVLELWLRRRIEFTRSM